MSVQSLPSDWPEQFATFHGGCKHSYHWDPAIGCYYCIWCDDEMSEPPMKQLSDNDGGTE